MQNLATDPEKYGRMVQVFRTADKADDLRMLSMMYVLDMSYPREDISLALKVVEKEKGWQ